MCVFTLIRARNLNEVVVSSELTPKNDSQLVFLVLFLFLGQGCVADSLKITI